DSSAKKEEERLQLLECFWEGSSLSFWPINTLKKESVANVTQNVQVTAVKHSETQAVRKEDEKMFSEWEDKVKQMNLSAPILSLEKFFDRLHQQRSSLTEAEVERVTEQLESGGWILRFPHLQTIIVHPQWLADVLRSLVSF